MKHKVRPWTLVAFAMTFTLSSNFFLTPTFANQNVNCKIQSSDNHLVSLGFPMRKERLSQIPNPKILVVPFQLVDEPDYKFTDKFKKDYEQAASIISDMSLGKVKVRFEFADVVKTELSNDDMANQRMNQQTSWMTDPEKSTWGLVRRLIKNNDNKIDYRGFHAVILEGSTTNRFADINEAMSFQENPQNPWFKSIQTDEGVISNAILLDNHAYPSIITHEVMHLFGLTDLYGSGNGPGRLSLMSNMENTLLTFEKWVLGWHPDSQVTCITKISESGSTELLIDLNQGGHLAIIPTTPGSGYILDVSSYKETPVVSFYLLNNELRPPIQLFQSNQDKNREGLLLTDLSAVGQVLKGPDYSVIITSLQNNLLSVTLVKSQILESSEGKILTERALENVRVSKPYVLPASPRTNESDQLTKTQTNELEKKTENPKPSVVTPKKKTISCFNGKNTRKITGSNPICPRGYKIKTR